MDDISGLTVILTGVKIIAKYIYNNNEQKEKNVRYLYRKEKLSGDGR